MATRTANVNIRIEPAIKQQAADVFSECGLSFSDAINAFCRETIRRQSIPFRFTAKKRNPVDISNMTKEEFLTSLKEAEKGASRPAEEFFEEFARERDL